MVQIVVFLYTKPKLGSHDDAAPYIQFHAPNKNKKHDCSVRHEHIIIHIAYGRYPP